MGAAIRPGRDSDVDDVIALIAACWSQYPGIVFDVDGEIFTGDAKGQQVGDYVGAFVWVNNPEFIYNLAKKKTLTITSPGRPNLIVNLQGTDAAFDKLRACQAAQ